MATDVAKAKPAKLGLFGGTFDPIHSGHVAVAQAALRRFRLNRIYFMPSGIPPHKPQNRPTPYLHRYAMVALVCAGNARFVPSLLEAGADLTGRQRFYSIQTLRRLRRQFPRARLYFILGADQFLELPTWKDYRALLKLCEFIVASRPGYDVKRATRVVKGARAHLLTAVHADVSATEIRRRVRRGQSLRGWLPAPVAQYIRTHALYKRS